MTKTFEEEAKEKILNSSRLYIAHEGAHADVDKDGGIALKIKGVVYVFPWLEFARNWHSDEEFQELFDKYCNLNDNYEKEVIRSSKLETSNLKLIAEGTGLLSDNAMLTKKVEDLKSQLQQQALPVVKDFVAEWYEEHKEDLDFSIFEVCISLYDDNSNDFKKWFGNSENKSIETLIRMKYGYTVEKPQLFYLKNKLTGDCLAICLARASSGLYVEVTEKWLTRKEQTSYKLYFTQKEIDSMQTGSYELVPVEDGE